jgi:hypothetical protein
LRSGGPGDVMKVAVGKLGKQRQTVFAFDLEKLK